MNFIVLGIHLSHCFTINITGETYIVPGGPYKVTCTVSDYLENRTTIYNAIKIGDDITEFKIFDIKTDGCLYRPLLNPLPCQSSICSCDLDGLSTNWIYSTPNNLSSSVKFRCTSKNNEKALVSSKEWIPTITSKCFFSINIEQIILFLRKRSRVYSKFKI